MKLCYVTWRLKKNTREQVIRMLTDKNYANIFRNQKGNVRFDFYIPVEGGNDILVLLDQWDNFENYKLHTQSRECTMLLDDLEPFLENQVSDHFTSDSYLMSIC